MTSKTSNPAQRGASAGLGNVQLGGKNSPEDTLRVTSTQLDFASAFIASRYRVPLYMADIIASLASLGGRAA